MTLHLYRQGIDVGFQTGHTVRSPQEEKAPTSDLDALLDLLRKSPLWPLY